MNRTIDINLGGMVFHIDENAYPVLNEYLQSLKKHFSTQKGGDEVMTDIEIRIAEMFQKHTNITKQNITIIDVEEVMHTMGSPENFESDDATASSKTNYTTPPHEPVSPVAKRIYRDTDSRILGGVCAGVSNYFAVDPIFIRLAFVVAMFGFGTGALVYLVLWIIIPEARTSAEKLQMHGEPINIANIEKTIKSEFNHVNQKFKTNDLSGQMINATRSISDNVVRILKVMVKIILTILAVLGAFIGGVLLLFLLQTLFASDAVMNISDNGVNYWPNGFRIDSFFDNLSHVWQAKLALVLVLGVPLITMVYNGVRTLLGVARNKYWIRVASALWLVGLLLSIVSFNRINKVFSNTSSLKNSVYLNAATGKTLVLKTNNISNEDDDEIKFGVTLGSILFNNDNETNVNKGIPSLKILKSSTDSAYVIITKQANSSTKKMAASLANQLTYSIQLTDSVITIDNMFNVNNLNKWRNQRLSVKVYLPLGQKIFIDPSVQRLLDDVDNVSNTYDGDMVNHTWQMQTQGLVCLDKITNDEEVTNDNDTEDVNMSISKDGVYVNGKRVDDDKKEKKYKHRCERDTSKN